MKIQYQIYRTVRGRFVPQVSNDGGLSWVPMLLRYAGDERGEDFSRKLEAIEAIECYKKAGVVWEGT